MAPDEALTVAVDPSELIDGDPGHAIVTSCPVHYSLGAGPFRNPDSAVLRLTLAVALDPGGCCPISLVLSAFNESRVSWAGFHSGILEVRWLLVERDRISRSAVPNEKGRIP